MLYSLGNNDKKKCLHMFSYRPNFFYNIFDPRLVKSAGEEPVDTECELYIAKAKGRLK
jgi:hypothetical protein